MNWIIVNAWRSGIVVIIVVCVLLVSPKLLASFHTNSNLICWLEGFVNSEESVDKSHCTGIWTDSATKSLSILAVRSSMGLAPDLSLECVADFCSCESESTKGISHNDPRKQLIILSSLISYHQKTGKIPQIENCLWRLPSSSYFYLASLDIEKAVIVSDMPGISEFTSELAYLADSGWSKPHWRGLNAYRQGVKYVSAGEYSKATEAFQRVQEVFGESNYQQKEEFLALASAGIAEIKLQDDDHNEAFGSYEYSISSTNGNRKNLIDAYIDALYEQTENDALVQLKTFITEQQDDPKLLHDIVVSLVSKSYDEDAETLLNQFHSPQSPYWLATNGIMARRLNDYEIAESYFVQALELYDGEEAYLKAQWAARLAVVRILQGDIEGGIEAQRIATNTRPESPYYWYDLATFYRLQPEYQSALDAINRAVALAPDNENFGEFKRELVAQMEIRTP